MTSTPAISLDRVEKRYGTTVAVRDLTFEVQRGEMFGLIGPDGAGKTTTIRMMCGLLPSDDGTIRVLGRDPVRERRAITHSVGYLSQRFSLYGDLSVDENIAFFAEIHGVAHYSEARDRLLSMTQLAPFRNRLAQRLSGGMKQKLALACTLIHEPELILLDEPTTGVDPVSRREFWKLLSEFRSQGITILMSTPYLDEAERCSRVALVHEGRLLALDAPGSLRRIDEGSLAVLEVIATPHRRALEVLRSGAYGRDVQGFGDRAHVRVAPASARSATGTIDAELRAAGITVVSLRMIPSSLEDIFIDLIERSGPGLEAPAPPAPSAQRKHQP